MGKAKGSSAPSLTVRGVPSKFEFSDGCDSEFCEV